MGLSDIREQIKTILSGVPGIGRIHDYDRWAVEWNAMLSLFKDSDEKINGWIITRRATPERWITNRHYERVYEFLVRGVYGLKDEAQTEIIFQDMIESICDAFRIKNTLNDTCETIAPGFGKYSGLSGIQVETVEQRIFGSVLCHYCELGLCVQVMEEIEE